MAEEPTIRTVISRVIQNQSEPEPVRELALEVLHWRLRDRLPEASGDERVRIRPDQSV
jgi:hypothetical protein